MVTVTVFLTFLASLCLVAADITIVTTEPKESCLKPNLTTSSTPAPHVVSSFALQKCCPIGWHMNLSEASDMICVKGDHSVEIHMVFMLDRESEMFELLELENYTIHVKLLSASRTKHVLPTEGPIFLDQNGNLGEIDDCKKTWQEEFCVDYDVDFDMLRGLYRLSYFNAQFYVEVPCMLTSIACLIFVIIVYWWVPAFNDLTGNAVTGLACNLLVMYFFLVLDYLDALDNIIVEHYMEDISYLCCGIWLILLSGNICVNIWFYLPSNARMSRPRVRKIFLSTVVLCVTFFGTMSALGVFTDKFPSKAVLDILAMVVLLVCSGINLGSWFGLRNFWDMQQLRYSSNQYKMRHPKFNKTDVKKFGAMWHGACAILCYAIFCYILKHCAQDTYDVFNAMAGSFIFVVLVCYRRPRKIIAVFWRGPKTEELQPDTANMTESLTKGAV